MIAVDPETGFKTPLGHQKSKELVTYLKERKYLDAKTKGQKH